MLNIFTKETFEDKQMTLEKYLLSMFKEFKYSFFK